MSYSLLNEPITAWSSGEQSDRRFSRILRNVLFVFLLLSFVMPFLPLPEKKKDELKPIPPQLARLLLERQTAPRPRPVIKKQEIARKKRLARKRIKKRQKKVARARTKASTSGLLALSSELSSLRNDSRFTSSLSQKLNNKRSSGKRSSSTSVIARRASKGSGGINAAALSRETGGTGLGSRSTTQVKGSMATAASSGRSRPRSASKARKEESLRLVFDRYKSAIYRIYNRALRQDPGLQGKVVLEMTIDSSGRVLQCRVVSSELQSKALLRKLVARVKLFDFGPRAGGIVKVRYPIEFFPS